MELYAALSLYESRTTAAPAATGAAFGSGKFVVPHIIYETISAPFWKDMNMLCHTPDGFVRLYSDLVQQHTHRLLM